MRSTVPRLGWCLLATVTAIPAPALADNEKSSGGGPRELPEWFLEDSEFDASATLELDYRATRDAVLVPAIGARWFGRGPGGALAVGMGVGGWHRWTSTLSPADIGLSMLLYYEGYDGAARGRSLRMASRFVLGGGPVHLKLGGDLGTSRHRFDFRPHLDGVMVGGPAADLNITHHGYGWVGGMALDYFLQDARPPQAADSPAADWSDEFSWYAGVSMNSSVWKYVQQWNAEGPMHLIMSTTLF
jgi:hypothetical protein